MTRGLFPFLSILLGGLLLAALFVPPSAGKSGAGLPIHNWGLADVRALDPADAPAPALDLLAVYLHASAAGLDVRLDFLGSEPLPITDLLLAIDTHPGGTRRLPGGAAADLDWDVLAVIPARGVLRLLDVNWEPVRGAGMRVLRNPALDQVSVRVDGLPGLDRRTRAQAFAAPHGSEIAADRTAPTSAMPQSFKPARAALVFTNAFPAYSPAAALRRWRGAHTGPLGGSHGLSLLLGAAQQAGAALAVLDLRRPEALAALEAVGGMSLVTQMEQQGLLVLPAQIAEGNGSDQAVAEIFGLKPARYTYTQSDIDSKSIVFLDDPEQLENGGPSLELRRALIAAALDANRTGGRNSVLILGGELPNSAWGAANHANTAFHYLASRPWLHLLTGGELADFTRNHTTRTGMSAPARRQEPPAFAPDIPEESRRELLAALRAAPRSAPAGTLAQAAQQAYRSLSAPVYPAATKLPALRAGYTGVVWSLLSAAGWAERPQPRLDCQSDPDRDGQPECILANARWYAQFESDGTLTHLFGMDAGVLHQWIAPSAQFITGLSDAQGWDLRRGLLADPAVIPGAFYETGPGYQIGIEGNRLVFQTDSGMEKTFSLDENGLRAVYHTRGAFPFTQIPISLAPDPWQRFKPGWMERYTWSLSEDRKAVEIQAPGDSGAAIQVSSSCPLQVAAFNDSLQWLDQVENPDRDYPPGHYLPFPMFLLECSTGTQTGIMIYIGSQ